MEYLPAFSQVLREQFDALSESDKALFAAAEAQKLGVETAAKMLGCDVSLVRRGLRQYTTRAVNHQARLLEEAFAKDGAPSIQELARAISVNNAGTVTLAHLRRLWKHLNSIRSVVNRSRFWPTSPRRAQDLAKDTYDALAGYLDWRGCSFFDLGCGNSQPYCTSAVMYLNGASSMIALDIDGTSPSRAAVALYDILVECVLFPDAWHWSGISQAEFLARISHFDLAALRDGSIAQGLARVPLKHVVGDVSDCDARDVDAISSRVVLEHLMDFERANRRIFEILRPGGHACHKIDLSDHRKKRGKHAFSFLAEENWTGDTNRLRSSEIRSCFEDIGFEILRYDEIRWPLPQGFEAQMLPRYRAMDRADVEVIEVFCVLRRPS